MDAELRYKRLGKLGASEAGIIMGGLNADTLEALIKQKAFERTFGDPNEDGFTTTGAMDRGQLVEPLALDWYEFTYDVPLQRQCHIDHPTIPMVSATPDGYHGAPDARCVEAKSPQIQAWMHSQKTGQIPAVYYWQCAWQSWCAETAYTDWLSFHPMAPHKTKVLAYTLNREDIEAMQSRVIVVESRIRVWQRILEN